MVSASLRKSFKDLSRRRARTLFTVATLALAVASISFLAIPTLIDRAMQEEVRADRLAHLTVSMRPLELTDEELAGLAALPNVEAVEPRSEVDVRVLVGARRAPAVVVGVRDFARQSVDRVRLETGAWPQSRAVLSEIQNANVGVYGGDAGDTVTLVAAGGAVSDRLTLPVSGRARNISGGERVQDDDVIVLYADAAAVSRLSGEPGYASLAFRLRDTAAAGDTIAAVRDYLRAVPGFTGFSDLPGVRAEGDWPGKDETGAFADILTVIALLALLSALVLISNTMTTLVAEQTGEIGIMRAIGARRRQVALVYVKTALLLGALGAVTGVVLGTVFANLLAQFFATEFWAVDTAFGVDATVVALSAAVGVLGPALAALPAIRRGVRVDLREALESTSSAVGGQDAGDRLLRRARFLPRAMQIGLRSVGRRRRRSLATVLIVALAVGNLLAFMGLSESANRSSRQSWGDHREDVRIWIGGRALFDERAERTIRTTPGVAEAQPALVNAVDLAGEEAVVWGMPREPLFRYRLSEGRWFTAAEEQAREPVAVIERILAEETGVGLGDTVTLATAAGPAQLRIVGVAKNGQEEGTALYLPLTTLRTVLDVPAGVTTYWIRTTSSDEPLVDATTARLEDRLAALGYEIGNEITYVMERDEIQENDTLTTSIGILGFVVVAISMAGLANAITTSIIERTREIGVLRCIGARGRDVRRIFMSEGLALALAGWVLGIPLGYALHRALIRLLREVANVELPVMFPAWNVVLALAGTLLLALLVLALPLRRAVRLRAGDALRYA